MNHCSRRTFLKLVGAGGAVVYLNPYFSPSLARAERAGMDPKRWLTAVSPIDRTVPETAPRQFFGDDPTLAHRVLWDTASMKAALAGQVPKPAEKTDLVIIGGGISGLTTAYLLKKHKPIVLELAPRFGGNAKGQSFRGMDYSIGAAYVVEPDEGSDIEKFFKELGIESISKIKEGEDPVSIGTNIYKEFWSGETVGEDEAAKEQFTKLSEYFHKVWDGEEVAYPDIPVTEDDQRAYIEKLDRQTFRDHILEVAGVKELHPHIETALEHYCWSSFGAAFSEIGAASGLNFYTAEFGNLVVCPGGNSAIAERLLSKVSEEVPLENLRPSSLVYEVSAGGDGVLVRYFDRNGAIRTLLAKAAVMACPKFVAARVLKDIEPARLDAIRKLRYHAYLVANVVLKTPPPEAFYDLYMLGDGKLASKDIATETARKGVTDVILANFALPSQANETVLTLYRGMPFDGARALLYAPTSYETYRKQFEEQINRAILPLLKLSPSSVVDLRISRWGHPLPVAAPGLIADKVVDRLREPFQKRVFFVEQDNWALPAFETSVTEAFTWAPEVEKLLT